MFKGVFLPLLYEVWWTRRCSRENLSFNVGRLWVRFLKLIAHLGSVLVVSDVQVRLLVYLFKCLCNKVVTCPGFNLTFTLAGATDSSGSAAVLAVQAVKIEKNKKE